LNWAASVQVSKLSGFALVRQAFVSVGKICEAEHHRARCWKKSSPTNRAGAHAGCGNSNPCSVHAKNFLECLAAEIVSYFVKRLPQGVGDPLDERRRRPEP